MRKNGLPLFFADMAQVVERVLGKDEVGGSSPPISSKQHFGVAFFFSFMLSIIIRGLEPPTSTPNL